MNGIHKAEYQRGQSSTQVKCIIHCTTEPGKRATEEIKHTDRHRKVPEAEEGSHLKRIYQHPAILLIQ